VNNEELENLPTGVLLGAVAGFVIGAVIIETTHRRKQQVTHAESG
jgi:hypothetical protein